VGLGLAAGCGFFDLRSPVPPEEIVVIPSLPWNTADNVLYNMEQAIRYKQDGLAQYEESLSELDFQELGTGLVYLSRESDIAAHRRFVNDIPDSFYFAFGEELTRTETDTTVFYDDIPYELLYIGPAGDTVGTARGVAELLVKEVRAARWAVATWVDQRADTSKTLGFLHGERAAGP
jgi:hypothetical protein